jgi:hypothetical protein
VTDLRTDKRTIFWGFIISPQLAEFIHFESCLTLKQVQFSIIGTQSESTVLFRDGEDWGFEIAESEAFQAAFDLMLQTLTVVNFDLSPGIENRYPSFPWPRTGTQARLLPRRSSVEDRVVGIMLWCILRPLRSTRTITILN